VSKESLGRLEKGNTGLSGQFMTDVRAVLFDLDGTLLDTLEDIGRSANETLEELGFPPHPIPSNRTGSSSAMGYRCSFAALCRRV
jgi:haloacid dehalogenase-like hydrolase